MYKECNVVMIPTKKSSFPNCVWLNKYNNILHTTNKFEEILRNIDPMSDKIEFQELYIVSDEEIKEDDWCIYLNRSGSKILCKCKHTKYGIVYQKVGNAIKNYGNKDGGITPDKNEIFKIIATNDKSLNLLQPSSEWINYFIDQDNKGNVIDKVMVEYEELNSTHNQISNAYLDNRCPCCNEYIDQEDFYSHTEHGGKLMAKYFRCNSCASEYTIGYNRSRQPIQSKITIDNSNTNKVCLKLNPDNTINIELVKDSWSREEITDLLKRFCNDYDILTSVDYWTKENL